MDAARRLRDAVDGVLATFDETDELQTTLGNAVDVLDEQFIRIAEWLLSAETNPKETKQ